MQLSNEIKGKVFAQYFGKRASHNSGKNIGRLVSLRLDDDYSSLVLILKPLSDITDEDAIAACKAGYPLAFMGNNKISKWKTERKKKFVSITTKYSAFSFEFDTEGCPLIDMYDDGGLSNVFRNEFAYQYLQSQGYDLPHYLLDGKTLHEAGLAIYETQN